MIVGRYENPTIDDEANIVSDVLGGSSSVYQALTKSPSQVLEH
jgi:hypothetical protein